MVVVAYAPLKELVYHLSNNRTFHLCSSEFQKKKSTLGHRSNNPPTRNPDTIVRSLCYNKRDKFPVLKGSQDHLSRPRDHLCSLLIRVRKTKGSSATIRH